MKTKVSLMVATLFLCGCPIHPPANGNGQPPDWEKLAPLIQARVRYVASFAFAMESVKPHKQAICDAVEQLADFLNSYDDQGATFEHLHKAVLEQLSKISDPNVRQAMLVITDMVFTEAFRYAWKHYEDFINHDQAKVALIIAKAVAGGLQEACGVTVAVMEYTDSPDDIFTVP